MQLHFQILGAPRTKKNSNVLDLRGAKPKKLPSKALREWNASAQMQLAVFRARECSRCIGQNVNCKALIYREALSGDANGFYQAIADALQEGRIIENDGLIVSWDGSRLLKDARAPRVEVTLETVDY